MYIAVKDILDKDEEGNLVLTEEGAPVKIGEYTVFPYSKEQLKKDNPNTTFPKEISEELLRIWKVFKVVVDPIPTKSPSQLVFQDEQPQLIDNVWRLGWSIRDYSQEEVEELKNIIRAERDTILAQSDWTHVTDSVLTETQKASWATYRQALRDISSQAGFPFEIQWPVKPN